MLIFLLCFVPGKNLPEVDIPLIDKWTHIVLFGVFSFLWLIAWQNNSVHVITIILASSFYTAWLVEYIQGHFVPDRSQDVMDIIADAIGSITGSTVFCISFLQKRIVS